MTECISKVSTGLVTYAVRDTEIDGKVIKEGDILGIIESKIDVVGNDVYEVCEKLVNTMVNSESELISIYYGKECEENRINGLVSKLEDEFSDLDVECNDGKQPLYYFIVSVE